MKPPSSADGLSLVEEFFMGRVGNKIAQIRIIAVMRKNRAGFYS